MFRMSFSLKEKKDGTLNLVLPVWFRILFLFIAILIAGGIITSGIWASGQWIAFLIFSACIAGGLYEEKWIFNKSTGKIVYIFGLIFINKKTKYKIEEAEIFKITGESHTGKEGKLNRIRKKMIKFSLILKNGKVLDIDIITGRTNSSDLTENAQKIAAYCGKELAIDS